MVWLYTLLLPVVRASGWLPITLPRRGPFGIELLQARSSSSASTGLDQITHCLFWSMLANIGCYVGVSLPARRAPPSTARRRSSSTSFKQPGEPARASGAAARRLPSCTTLLGRFLGPERAQRGASRAYARERGLRLAPTSSTADADARALRRALLAGAIGARLGARHGRLGRQEEPLGLDEVMHILDEASQVIAYSRQLEQKSRELEAATAELRAANQRLQELDRLKDDFISTVTHELRTPLTSIRAFSEILHDNPELDAGAARDVPRHHHQGDPSA